MFNNRPERKRAMEDLNRDGGSMGHNIRILGTRERENIFTAIPAKRTNKKPTA
jgi:hypothetical protein